MILLGVYLAGIHQRARFDGSQEKERLRAMATVHTERLVGGFP